MKIKYIKVFLRLSLALGFLSAVADRFGFWPEEISSWGSWASFVDYTAVLNPWVPAGLVSFVAIIATLAELVLAFCLIMGFKTRLAAQLSGLLLLTFALAMLMTLGLKAPLDYSVFSAAAAAFGLSLIKETYWELDEMRLV